ncbi:MAG: hypothetical protein EBY18_19405, partial [Alphaproteobacteria bacterium]|nr:hypothetical protein [Alphaproteobacteria bacterium]
MPSQTIPPSQTVPFVLPLQGGSNFRDLGGYRTADGRAVRSGVVFRSAHLGNLTDDDRAALVDERISQTTNNDMRNYLNKLNSKTSVTKRDIDDIVAAAIA